MNCSLPEPGNVVGCIPGKVDARCFESFFWLLGSSQWRTDFIFFSDGVGWMYPCDLPVSFLNVDDYDFPVPRSRNVVSEHVETSTGKKSMRPTEILTRKR